MSTAPVTAAVATTCEEPWWEWTQKHVDYRIGVLNDAVGEVIGSERKDFQAALDKRDREIKLLRRELGTLRSEVELKLKLKTELAAARAEVEELRQRAPDFKAELDAARQELAKQERIISRLRGAQSTLEYQQKQLDAELSQMKRTAASAAAVVQFETSSSRITVGNLHPDAANALREFASQVVDAEDGDAILFSGPAGTA